MVLFAERFDALMNIAEVSNSLLGRDINMNPAHIGRLRSGARPLAKKHDYLPAVCTYLVKHITKEYQMNALQKLTGIPASALSRADAAAVYLERWLIEEERDAASVAKRLISGFSRVAARPVIHTTDESMTEVPMNYFSYLYGNAGKRKAVEQFFYTILQENTPQTLLLFSDENMAWLYEDAAFAAKWAELFKKVIERGNRVKIIHTITRDINDMFEAIAKWIPIYMTGAVEPYFYPKLRDGLFQRTLFIAPDTAAVISSSVQQDTDGMLNMFITDKSALDALKIEYEHYLSLCRPLMRILTEQTPEDILKAFENLASAEEDAFIYSAMPPIFTMPESVIEEFAKKHNADMLISAWKRAAEIFRSDITNHRICMTLLDPELALLTPDTLYPPMAGLFCASDFVYTMEQYIATIEHIRHLEMEYENVTVKFSDNVENNTMIYVKEDVGVFMAKTDSPITVFTISERNMTGSFWDYMKNSLFI